MNIRGLQGYGGKRAQKTKRLHCFNFGLLPGLNLLHLKAGTDKWGHEGFTPLARAGRSSLFSGGSDPIFPIFGGSHRLFLCLIHK